MKPQPRHRPINIMLSAVVAAAFASTAFAQPTQKPLKVFILAGQSNMEGHAKLSSFPVMSNLYHTPPEHHQGDVIPLLCLSDESFNMVDNHVM